MPAESSPCIQFLRFLRRSHRFVPLLLRLLIESIAMELGKNLESHVHENLMVVLRLCEATVNCIIAD